MTSAASLASCQVLMTASQLRAGQYARRVVPRWATVLPQSSQVIVMMQSQQALQPGLEEGGGAGHARAWREMLQAPS